MAASPPDGSILSCTQPECRRRVSDPSKRRRELEGQPQQHPAPPSSNSGQHIGSSITTQSRCRCECKEPGADSIAFGVDIDKIIRNVQRPVSLFVLLFHALSLSCSSSRVDLCDFRMVTLRAFLLSGDFTPRRSGCSGMPVDGKAFRDHRDREPLSTASSVECKPLNYQCTYPNRNRPGVDIKVQLYNYR